MRILAALMILIGLSSGHPARADGPVLVELFTSQGCSSCPPADALLPELAERADVIALAYHVDYWDYLGWRDTFAQAAFSERQGRYSTKVDRTHIRGHRFGGSFTPEVVVQGVDSLIGSDGLSILARVSAHAAQPTGAELKLSREGEDLIVELQPGPGAASAAVKLAAVLPRATVEIARGENARRTLTYHHIVQDLRRIHDWDGTSAVRLRVPGVPGQAVVFVQDGKAGRVFGAAEIAAGGS